jgi:hypothetical protein
VTDKTCEVWCIRIPAKPGCSGPHAEICGKLAVYFVKGCVGPLDGQAFVCEEHKNFYAQRVEMTVGEYWMLQAEKALEDKKRGS